MPPMTFIDCEVINDMLVFDANFDYEYMNVEVTGSEINSVINSTFTFFEPYIITNRLSGECTIRCTTDGGSVYEGTITL